MQDLTVPKGSDRRRSPRFPLPIGRVSGAGAVATLLNISRQGMALEVPATSPFSEGDSHSFTLQDLSHSVNVKGTVRWVQTDWRDPGGAGRVQYIQIAGFTFEEILTPDPSGIWSNLKTTYPDPGEEIPIERAETSESLSEEVAADKSTPSTRTVRATRPEPPMLVAPRDGESTSSPTLQVVCAIPDSETVTAVSINGVGASLEGEQASAEIVIHPGDNRLSALVSREDGSYRSYSLGRVTRKDWT